MLPPLIQRRGRSHRTREQGVTMALVALSLVAIISMAALSIDIGTLYQASAEAQRAADAAALAGARMIAMSGLTGDPTNGATGGTVSWGEICGGPGSPASLAAIAIAQQNTVGGLAPSVTVNYSAGGAAAGSSGSDCTAAGTNFGINPVVTVKVQQPNLPTFFAHIFGLFNSNWNKTSVSATASAEAFNSSNAGSYSIQPRCVKPWIVPNYDPNGSTCTTGCTPFVDTGTGAIQRPGILADGGGVIGEQFWLVADCTTPGSPKTCTLLVTGGTPPQANYGGGTAGPPNLEYLPALISPSASASTAVPTCPGSPLTSNYAEAIAGCDQSTQYQCGNALANAVDLTENPIFPPGNADTPNGTQCLIHQSAGSAGLGNGQDALLPAAGGSFPFQIQAGTNNPVVLAPGGLTSNTLITSSTSIVSLPIYDTSVTTFNPGGTTPVTIVGFLQVFINQVDGSGNVQVTVMNVTGCGSSPGATFNGTSSVPVRLITAP
jgi:hypothetical protein